VAGLPSSADFRSFKTHLDKSVLAFSRDNQFFKEDFEKHCEIIRRYDEVIA
jgi:hypothetical protein